MDEKEMKKIGEKGEEKVSGGVQFDADLAKKVKEYSKKCPHLAYGAMRPGILPLKHLKEKVEEIEKAKDPKDALAPSQPKTEEKNK